MIVRIKLDGKVTPLEDLRGERSRARSAEWIENEIPGLAKVSVNEPLGDLLLSSSRAHAESQRRVSNQSAISRVPSPGMTSRRLMKSSVCFQ
jgi:hypothetical protein